MFVEHKKILIFVMYIFFGWMIGLFVFGEFGILYNIHQSQQIIELSEKIWKSRIEIEEMTREYGELLEMKEPTQSFLIDQGRKTQNLLVFKIKDPKPKEEKTRNFVQEEKKSFIYTGVVALLFLFIGCAGIWYTISKYKGSK
ncbi:MAG: hypothetical protein ACRCV0_00120 [Brevinema sp.]